MITRKLSGVKLWDRNNFSRKLFMASPKTVNFRSGRYAMNQLEDNDVQANETV